MHVRDTRSVSLSAAATILLVASLQVALFGAVSGAHWPAAALLAYYLTLCLLYGFGTLLVALNTTTELDHHAAAVDALRVQYISSCYFAWTPHHGSLGDRQLAKDLCIQVKEVCPCNSRATERCDHEAHTHFIRGST